jgi:subtilisin family serine protease
LRLLAPGEVVESSVVGGNTDLASGTSMASSHVAGVIAAIREAIPSASADAIENALALSGVPVFDARNGITKPRIQVPETITLLETNGSPPGNGSGGTTPATTTPSGGGGGGGSCGLVGIESFLVLGLVRLGRRRYFAGRQRA